jgi:regulator of cell morphogenesis and NO signaling
MPIQSDTTVGQIATEHPLATRVFHRHGIDFCCGGGKPLKDACEARDLDTDTVIAELHKELESSTTPEERWDQATLDELIDHILVTYHEPLFEELPRLETMAGKVLEVHGDKDPDTLSELNSLCVDLRAELKNHMTKEEQILFPMIRSGQGAMASGPVAVMLQEHDSAANALRRFRKLTNDYEVPAEACNTWRALWHGLAALEEALHQHIHLENNILFPRALKS